MYTVDKTRSRKKTLLTFMVLLALFFAVVFLVLWIFVLRDPGSSSTQFEKAGGNTIAILEPAEVDFLTSEFKITLPEGWELLGKQRPYSNQEYYEFKSEVKDYENRWLRVYLDVFPEDYPINKLLPIKPNGDRFIVGEVSEDCKTFKRPDSQGSSTSTQTWRATLQDISFYCNMSGTNHTGTANAEYGYGVPAVGKVSGEHKYFFVYIDHNVRPDPVILQNAVESFEAV